MTIRIGNLSGRAPLGQKQGKAKPRPDYLAAVRGLPCIICDSFGEPQMSATTAHHPIMDRHSQRKRPDVAAIPLCDGHHQAASTGPRSPFTRPRRCGARLTGPTTNTSPARRTRWRTFWRIANDQDQ